MASIGLTHITAALGFRNYRIYMSGNAVSLVGLWVQRVAVGWLAFDLTGSGAWLGAMAFADLFPSLVVGPIAGVLADRLDRLTVVRIAQTLSMLQAAVLAALTAADLITVELLLLLVLINGVVVSFGQPARLALVSGLVPRANLTTAVALNSLTFNLARFIGPAVAGALILGTGVAAAFAVNAVSFIAFLVALYRLRLDPDDTRPATTRGDGMLSDIAAGFRYVRGHPAIGPLLLLSTATGLGVRGFVELLPAFAADVFARGAGGLAALASVVGVGAMAGGFWLAQRGAARELPTVALGSALFTILATLLLVATGRFEVGIVAVGIAGFAMSVSGIAIQTTVQLGAEPQMRGRALSLYGLIMRASPAAGALVLGAASDLVGLRLPVAVAAIACLLVWFPLWQRRRDMVSGRAGP